MNGIELLTQQGWTMYYWCMCGGSRREHYKSSSFPNHEIRVRPSRSVFLIMHKNRLTGGPDHLYKLDEDLLKGHEIYKA